MNGKQNGNATPAAHAQRKVLADVTDLQRKLVGDLLDYAERFAQVNNEPLDGHCRATISKAEAWFESGTFTVDPVDVILDLAEYVGRFADANDEPADGDCRTVLARAASFKRDAPLHEFAFDCVMTAAIRVTAPSLETGRQLVSATMCAADCNGGSWPDGSPVLFEASVHDKTLSVFQVDGVDVEEELVDVEPLDTLRQALELIAVGDASDARSVAQAALEKAGIWVKENTAAQPANS